MESLELLSHRSTLATLLTNTVPVGQKRTGSPWATATNSAASTGSLIVKAVSTCGLLEHHQFEVDGQVGALEIIPTLQACHASMVMDG